MKTVKFRLLMPPPPGLKNTCSFGEVKLYTIHMDILIGIMIASGHNLLMCISITKANVLR
jgi:hypothetical protein